MREHRKQARSKRQAIQCLADSLATISGDFAGYLRARGYADATVKTYQDELRRVAHWLSDSDESLNTIFREEVWDFLTRRLPGRSVLTLICYRKALFHWLKFQGRFRLRARPPPWQSLIDDYIYYLRVHRGIGESTRELRNGR